MSKANNPGLVATGKEPPFDYKCKKCGKYSGDDWRQCGGLCPVAGSPYYDKVKLENVALKANLINKLRPYFNSDEEMNLAALQALWEHHKEENEETTDSNSTTTNS